MRSRVLSTITPRVSNRYYWTTPQGVETNDFGTDVRALRVDGIQITESEGHPWENRKRAKLKPGAAKKLPDVGGDFFTQRKYVANGQKFPRYHLETKIPYFLNNRVAKNDLYFPGTGFPNSFPNVVGPSYFPDPSLDSDAKLNELGTTAISRCKPTNSPANVSTAIAEIVREGLPSLPVLNTLKSKGSPAAKASDELLNYEFGIAPVISDAKKFVSAVSKMDKLLVDFEKNAGTVVRRRYYFPIERTVSETTVPAGTSPWGCTGLNSLNGWQFAENQSEVKCVRRREIVKRRWFSGAFTYWLPTGMDSRTMLGEMALRADRLGVELTPETIWNLTPWSWAVDWFTNAGDVLSNYSAVAKYGLVMQYGYLMDHTIVSDTYTLTGIRTTDQYGSISVPVKLPSTTLVTETKRRRKANPFGFGVSWSGLSTTQQAIIAALGISRSSR